MKIETKQLIDAFFGKPKPMFDPQILAKARQAASAMPAEVRNRPLGAKRIEGTLSPRYG
jgi:hypothetical protein